MSWLHPGRRTDPRFADAIALHAAAQQRVSCAAEGAGAAAEEHREHEEAAVSGFRVRTEQRLARKSFARQAADAAIEQMAARVRRDLEDHRDP